MSVCLGYISAAVIKCLVKCSFQEEGLIWLTDKGNPSTFGLLKTLLLPATAGEVDKQELSKPSREGTRHPGNKLSLSQGEEVKAFFFFSYLSLSQNW